MCFFLAKVVVVSLAKVVVVFSGKSSSCFFLAKAVVFFWQKKLFLWQSSSCFFWQKYLFFWQKLFFSGKSSCTTVGLVSHTSSVSELKSCLLTSQLKSCLLTSQLKSCLLTSQLKSCLLTSQLKSCLLTFQWKRAASLQRRKSKRRALFSIRSLMLWQTFIGLVLVGVALCFKNLHLVWKQFQVAMKDSHHRTVTAVWRTVVVFGQSHVHHCVL